MELYRPHGILVAMATPMKQDGALDLDYLREYTRRFLKSRVHGLFCLGTNGEFYALDREEKVAVMEVVLSEAKGKLPVCCGVGCVTTDDTVYLAQKAQELGADALSVITPYFGQVSEASLIEHYKSVAASVDIGVIMYNIPARTGCTITRRAVEKLAAVENIVGIKDSSGNFDQALQYLEATGREFPVMMGNDSLILYGLMAGASGGIAGCCNMFPNTMPQIYDLFMAGEVSRAMEIQDGLRPIRDCFALGNPNSVVKRVTELLGFPVGPCRKPFGAADASALAAWDERIGAVLDKHYKGWH